jgi:hypothetical protein
MTITPITQKEYDTLLSIQKEFPALTFQNEGYEYLKKHNLTEIELEKFKEAEAILKKCILGFCEFNHFRISKLRNTKQEVLVARFQYNWTADDDYSKNPLPFTGVGYLEVEELFRGFRENWKFNCEECGKEVSQKELKEKTVECFKCKYNG